MNSKIEDLKKFLKLEVLRNYDNRSIVGGFQNLMPLWQEKNSFSDLDPVLYSEIIVFLNLYPKSSLSKRKQLLDGIQKKITLNQTSFDESKITQESSKQISDAQSSYTTTKRTLDEKSRTIKNKKHHIDLQIKSTLRSVNFIGKSREKALNQIGIFSIEDLIYFFPKKYEDYRTISTIAQLNYGDQVTIIATITSISTHLSKNRKISITEVIIDDGTGSLRVNFFNQPYLEKQISKDKLVAIKGKIDTYLGRLVINSPKWEIINEETTNINGIVPIYKIPTGFSQKSIKKVIKETLNLWESSIVDYLPEEIKKSSNLMNLNQAIIECHQPKDFESLHKANYRISFDQIFFLQMGVLNQKSYWNKKVTTKLRIKDDFLQTLQSHIPFQLTNAQNNSIKDIRRDFESGTPMNRLIQGDVGSGKTLVAFFSIAMILTQPDTQCAFMAPTSILASQHYQKAIDFFVKNNLIRSDQISLLIGDTSNKEKEFIKSELFAGNIRIIFGTHALIEGPIYFQNLKFVIIDEQHRFGVEQRKKLTEKGPSSHLLVMTATPIPRSLALTIYGDLDLSIMREMPIGRIPVKTQILKPMERHRVYKFIHSQVNEGKQAFIIYPLVESQDISEDEISNAAVNEFDRLKNNIFKGLNIALLHGKMNPAEKENIMTDFYKGFYQILVSTTVIEVGVDVPNATIMMIEGANRFGLAQLHQLRGRVGRGSNQAYCFLVPENDDLLENERLTALEKSNDGFELAEIDLKQRGPGDFLGERQSGFKDLQLMNIMNVELIECARSYAEKIFIDDPNLEKSENQEMKKFLSYYWNKSIGDIN